MFVPKKGYAVDSIAELILPSENLDHTRLQEPKMFVAYRGETPLSLDGYRAYLASLLRLENIGVLLGAGASVGAGGKVMRELWAGFLTQSPKDHEWLHDQGFYDDHSGTAALTGPPLTAPNVEVLLDTLAVATMEWERVADKRLPQAKSAKAAIYRALVRASKLDGTWWTQSGGPALSEPKLSDHRRVLQRLSAARQPGQSSPWVFTTNYDLAVEWAADSIDLNVINGFLGLHSRKFTPQSFDLGFRNVQARGEARFGSYNIYLAKLHGSLTWKQIGGQLFELRSSEAWPEIRGFLESKSVDFGFTVMPSAAKYVQTVGYVLGELLRRYAEFMSRPQTALIVSGYSFGDAHINRLLKSALLNPTFQLVVYNPGFTDLSDTEDLPEPLQELISLANPRVTLVGGSPEAYFSGFASHLPDPAIYNDDLKKLEERLAQGGSEELK